VILPDPIPGKGRVLTRISNFWFKKLEHIMPNHLADIPLEQVVLMLLSVFRLKDGPL